MAMRVCSEPGCPTLVAQGTRGGRCTACERKHDKARGTRQERGYGRQSDGETHDTKRKQWAPLVATGNVKCWRCRTCINPGEPWDLGHDDRDRTTYRGPEHERCNRATSGR